MNDLIYSHLKTTRLNIRLVSPEMHHCEFLLQFGVDSTQHPLHVKKNTLGDIRFLQEHPRPPQPPDLFPLTGLS